MLVAPGGILVKWSNTISEGPIFNSGVRTPFLTEHHRLTEASTTDANVFVESGEQVLFLQVVDYYTAAERLAQRVIESGGQDNVLIYSLLPLNLRSQNNE